MIEIELGALGALRAGKIDSHANMVVSRSQTDDGFRESNLVLVTHGTAYSIAK